MHRIIRVSLAFFLFLGLGSSIVGLIYLRRVYGLNEDIGPIRIDRTLASYCTEPQTTKDFQEFWREFRSAVSADDRDKLFPLIHTCRFSWWDQHDLVLREANCVPGPIEDCHPRPHYFGGYQIFESRHDFDMTYERIFTKANKLRILNGTPWQTSNGYAVSWEPGPNETYSLNFERIEEVGYKFAGLAWEPDPLEFLKMYAAKARSQADSHQIPFPPPNSTP